MSSVGSQPSIVRGLRKTFGRQIVLDGLDLEVEPRRGVRPPRPQRRRQDDDHQRPHDARPPRQRVARRSRASTCCAIPIAVKQRISLTGQSAAVDDVLTGIENLVMLGRLSGLARSAAQARADELLAAIRSDGCRDQARRRLLRRHAPPARPRPQLRRDPRGPLPRRADHGARHPQPPRAVGRHPHARRRRHHGVPDDAVPRGGRPARRPHRGARRRPGRRDRHRRRAEGPHRRRHRRTARRARRAAPRGRPPTAPSRTFAARSTSSTSQEPRESSPCAGRASTTSSSP